MRFSRLRSASPLVLVAEADASRAGKVFRLPQVGPARQRDTYETQHASERAHGHGNVVYRLKVTKGGLCDAVTYATLILALEEVAKPAGQPSNAAFPCTAVIRPSSSSIPKSREYTRELWHSLQDEQP